MEPMEPSLVQIRRFSDASIQAAVDRALASVPAGAHGAVLSINLNESSAGGKVFNAAIAAKINDQWSIAAAFQKDFTSQSMAGQVEVKFTW